MMNGRNRCLPGPFTSVEMTAPSGADNFGPGLVAALTGLRGRMVYFLAAGKKSKAAKSVKKAAKAKRAKPLRPTMSRPKPKAAAKKAVSKTKPGKTTAKKAASKKVSTARPVKKGIKKTATVKAKSGPSKRDVKKAPAKKPGTKTPGKMSTSKSLKPVKDDKAKRRKPRVYSTRSKLDGFFIGDEVIFKAVRDWSNAASLKEMRGVVVAMGNDPVNNVSYIEVQFDVEIIPGKTTKQTRRFMVK